MTIRSRAALKALFADNAVLNASDFVDLIDSGIILVDTSAQSLGSNISVSSLAVGVVCAATVAMPQVNASIVHATLSANLVRVSSVQHKNPFGYMWASGFYVASVCAIPATLTLEGATTAHTHDLIGFAFISGHLVYHGPAAAMTVYYHVSMSPDLVTSVGDFTTYIAKNGVVQPVSRMSQGVPNVLAPLPMNGTAVVHMVSGDSLDVYGECTASAFSMQVDTISLMAYPVSWTI
ncbi:MAG: hypothetical protein ACREXR_00390 [Gammaproteobacteria bacterium]